MTEMTEMTFSGCSKSTRDGLRSRRRRRSPRPPSKEWLWDNGRKVYWCKHTGIRDGWHRWFPWGADHWEEENSFWCKTEVALTSECEPTENHDGIVDLTTDLSDSDNDTPPNDAPPEWQLLPPATL